MMTLRQNTETLEVVKVRGQLDEVHLDPEATNFFGCSSIAINNDPEIRIYHQKMQRSNASNCTETELNTKDRI